MPAYTSGVRSVHVSEVIRRPARRVYDFAADPAHLPSWAAGLAQGTVTLEGSALIVDSPMGRVRVMFAAPNGFGILDHDVTLPDGSCVNNPLRVVAHPEGAEVVFTVRQLGLTDDEFDRDVQRVAADLRELKGLLET